MANRKPDYVNHGGHKLFADQTSLRRINSFSADANFVNEDILELANSGVAETIDDLESVSITVDGHEFGSTDNFANMVNYFQSGNNNNHYITDALFDNAQVDFALQVTSGTGTSALAATCWYGSNYLTGFSLSYSADGNATESYTFEGAYKRWFLNSYRDTRIVSGTATAASTATAYGVNLQTGYTPRVLTVNGVIQASVADGDTITFTNASANTSITATKASGGAVTFNSGDRIRAIYAKNVPDSYSTFASTPSGIGALRKGMIDVYIFNDTSGTQEKTLRLTSVTIDGSLDRTAANELGSNKAYSRTLTRPITVEASCEAYLSDLEVFAKIANAESTFDGLTLSEINWDSLSSDTKLIVKVYKSETVHSAANLLKTIVLDDCTLTSSNDSITAGDFGTVSFTLKTDSIIISGSATSPYLG